jgi:hypothetical protein
MKDNILSKLSEHLFWDCNRDMLDPYADRNLVLERFFTRGTENDERDVFRYYGKDLTKTPCRISNISTKKLLTTLA